MRMPISRARCETVKTTRPARPTGRQRQRQAAERPDDGRHPLGHPQLDVEGVPQHAGRDRDARIDGTRRADEDPGHRRRIAVDPHDHHRPVHVLVVHRVVELRGSGIGQRHRRRVPHDPHDRRSSQALPSGSSPGHMARANDSLTIAAPVSSAWNVPATAKRNPHDAEVVRIDVMDERGVTLADPRGGDAVAERRQRLERHGREHPARRPACRAAPPSTPARPRA